MAVHRARGNSAKIDTEELDRLEDLYHAHIRDELGTHDALWSTVQRIIEQQTKQVCRTAAHGLHSEPLRQIVVEVQGEILRKFLQRRLPGLRSGAFPAAFCRTVRNAMTDAFRARRSPCTVSTKNGMRDDPYEPSFDESETEMVNRLRNHLGQFRFNEYHHLREAILNVLIARHTFPGVKFVSAFGVPPRLRQVVYNAAVADINIALTELYGSLSA